MAQTFEEQIKKDPKQARERLQNIDDLVNAIHQDLSRVPDMFKYHQELKATQAWLEDDVLGIDAKAVKDDRYKAGEEEFVEIDGYSQAVYARLVALNSLIEEKYPQLKEQSMPKKSDDDGKAIGSYLENLLKD